MRRRRGWVFLDVLVGLMILGIIGLTLGAGAAWHQRALAHLSDMRAASRVAESALISMQAREQFDRSKVVCREVAGAQNPAGMSWVEVSAKVNGRSASLVGLVPKESLSAGGGS
jgi:Tfp pilus assembly protein PilX